MKITHKTEILTGISPAVVFQAWHSNVKTIFVHYKILCISKREISKTYVKNACEVFE
jgi:hypothetical protein